MPKADSPRADTKEYLLFYFVGFVFASCLGVETIVMQLAALWIILSHVAGIKSLNFSGE